MYCPNCGEEFDSSVTVCKDCEIQLVDLLPEETHAKKARRPGNQVVVLSTMNPAELTDARSLLEDAEIPYYVDGGDMPDYPGGGRLGYIPGEGPFDIQVGAEDEDEARQVLRELRDNRNPDEQP